MDTALTYVPFGGQKHRYASVLGVDPGVKRPDHRAYMYFALVGTAKHFSEVVVPTCVPTGNVRAFRGLHILASTWYRPWF